jgi:hypothetical protein
MPAIWNVALTETIPKLHASSRQCLCGRPSLATVQNPPILISSPWPRGSANMPGSRGIADISSPVPNLPSLYIGLFYHVRRGLSDHCDGNGASSDSTGKVTAGGAARRPGSGRIKCMPTIPEAERMQVGDLFKWFQTNLRVYVDNDLWMKIKRNIPATGLLRYGYVQSIYARPVQGAA